MKIRQPFKNTYCIRISGIVVHASGVNHNVLICDRVLADTSKIVSNGMANAFFVAVVSKSAGKTTMDGEYNIGRRIKEYVEGNGIRIGWLSQRLHCHRNTLYNIFERNWIDTQMLMRLCEVLKHDFFAELSEHYKKRSGEGEEK